jgi:phage anti-repressor protein
MKTVSINKEKVKIFEENELKEKLKLSQEQIDLILKYQRMFPELLQKKTGLCINGRTLWEQLGKPQGEFNKWVKRKIINKNYKLNIDYISYDKIVEREKGGTTATEYILTINCANKITMRENMDIGDLVCDYFILMENTLRNYEEWVNVREPEKQGYNEMRQYISDWCIRRGCDPTIKLFYTREADMLNENLLGKKAQDIKGYIGYDDSLTREHLTTEINKSLYELQTFNINLLNADMSFEERSKLIKTMCNNKYSHLKLEKVS